MAFVLSVLNIRSNLKNNKCFNLSLIGKQLHYHAFAYCIVLHCLLLPALFPLFAVTLNHGHALHEFWFHQFILIFILPFSIFAIIAGYKRHRQTFPLVISTIGLCVFLFLLQYLLAH